MFSSAEQKVVDQMILGLAYKEIANRIFRSEKAVKWHVSAIFKKMGVRSRAEFMAKINGKSQGVNMSESEYVSVREARAAEVLPSPQDKRNMAVAPKSQEDKIQFIDEKFRVGNTIEQLHSMMKEVTKEEITPATVSAACNCVARLNETINTAIQAARFLNER